MSLIPFEPIHSASPLQFNVAADGASLVGPDDDAAMSRYEADRRCTQKDRVLQSGLDELVMPQIASRQGSPRSNGLRRIVISLQPMCRRNSHGCPPAIVSVDAIPQLR
jgi:hypothetical protein